MKFKFWIITLILGISVTPIYGNLSKMLIKGTKDCKDKKDCSGLGKNALCAHYYADFFPGHEM